MSTNPSRTHWTAETLNQALADPYGPFKRHCKIGLNSVALDKAIDLTNSYTLATITAWLRSVRPDIHIMHSENVEQLVACDHVWCSANSEEWDKVNSLGALVVQAGREFLVGGHHATALPQTLKHGAAFLGPLELYQHLDELPLPDWDIFGKVRCHLVITSRGCPYHCNFCSSSSFWKRYHARSAARVIEEIQLLKERGTHHITIFDDLFIAQKARLTEIVRSISDKGLSELKYACLVRSNLIDSDTIDLLKAMNVTELGFGAESASDRVLAMMGKNATVAENQRAIDLLFKKGYKPAISLIAGYPGESDKDLEQTVAFVERNRAKCSLIAIHPCIPLPGTLLWQWFVLTHGIDPLHFDWESLNINVASIDWDRYRLLTDHYSKQLLIEVVEWNEKEKAKHVLHSEEATLVDRASRFLKQSGGVVSEERWRKRDRPDLQ
jgi:pyruvate-formate lyase-activating enzyme